MRGEEHGRHQVKLLLLCVLAQFPGFGDFSHPTPGAMGPRAEDCRECHPQVTREWQASRHRHSLDNRVFLDGLAAEPHQRCVVCHAPSEEQVREVRRAWTPLIHSLGDAGLPADAAAREGISCATCHVRDGVVLTGNPRAEGYGHPLKYEPLLARPEFCAACHEFRAHRKEADGTERILDEPMQTTFTEWREWGGNRTCQQCHMPNGSHDFHGGHDVERVRSAISLTREGDVAVLRTHGVGHHLPTGDVFRHLVLWADDVKVREFGRRYARRDDADGGPHLLLEEDTSLRPDAEVRVTLPHGARVVRLTYHFALDLHELRGTLLRDELMQELFVLRR